MNLQLTNEIFKKVFDHTSAIMFLVDQDKKVVAMNQNGLNFLGSQQEDVCSKKSGELFGCKNSLQDLKACGEMSICKGCSVLKILKDTIINNKCHNRVKAELKIIRDEEEIHLNLLVSARPLDHLYLVTIEDVTDLSKLESDFEMYFSSSTQAMYKFSFEVPISIDMSVENQIDLFNKNIYLERCNDKYAKLVGFKNSLEIEGKPLNKVFENIRGSNNIISEFIENNYTWINFNLEVEHFNGTRFSCIENAKGFTKDGKLHSVWGSLVDITENKILEEEKNEIQKKLFHSSKLAAIGELAAGVGHEINNPLAIINGTIYLMKKNIDQSVLPSLEIIEKSCLRIKNIVDGLRSFAREDDVTQEELNINSIIDETVGLANSLYEREHIKIEKDLQAKDCFVVGRVGHVQQVLMNILTNAKDALAGSAEAKIKIGTRNCGKSIKIAISDNGVGIKNESLPNIFKSFYSTKKANMGTGLGLSISQDIVHKMGGDIHVDSEENVGSTFTITLPFGRLETTLDLSDEIKLWHLTGRVLLVDDEEDIRNILSSILKEIGFEVVEASDGVEAIEILQNSKFTFVLTDINMPELSGDHLIDYILNQNRDEKIIAISGGVMIGENDDLLSKVDGFIRKPFSPIEIFTQLKKQMVQGS